MMPFLTLLLGLFGRAAFTAVILLAVLVVAADIMGARTKKKNTKD
jgi:uncharacterized membrane protein